MNWWGNMMGWYGNGPGWPAGMFFMGLFWVALIVGAVVAVVRLTQRPDAGSPASVESARQVLDRRLAAGEIDAEQYAETRRILEGRSVDEAHR